MIDVFISVGRTATEEQEAFVSAVFEHLRANGLNPRALGRSDWSSEQPLKFIEKLMDQCSGTVIIAFERIFIADGSEHRLSKSPKALAGCQITTPWNQIEAAMAYARKQPLLVLMENGLRVEGLLDTGFDWWVQSCPLDPSSLQTSEFTGVLADWKNRVEQFGATAAVSSPPREQIKIDEMTVGQLLGLLKPKQLWALLLLVLTVLGGSFKAGHSFGPTFLGRQEPTASVSSITHDDLATLKALRALTEKDPPLQGNSTDGNVRPQMEAYIAAFEVSNNPKLLRAVMRLLGEVEDRENPAKPREYFDADSQFRAELDSFRSRVRVYSETGKWKF